MNISAYLGVAGLSDIGYRFYTAAEVAVAARVTTGIVDAADGWYSADATIPATGVSVRWDSTGTADAKAREYIDNLNDPFTKVVPNGYAAGTAGKKLGGLPDEAAGSVGGLLIAGSNPPVTMNISGNLIGDVTGDVLGRVHGSVDSVTNAPTEATIAAAVRDVSNATPVAGSLGADVKSAASGSTDPWLTTLPGAYAAGSAGKILGDRLDVLVSSRLATSAFIPPIAAADIAAATRDVNNLTPAANSLGAAVNSAASAGDPWGTPLPGAYAAGTAGKIIGDRIDVLVSSRLATAGYTVPPTANVIADSVRDVNNLTPAANSLGAAVNAAASAGDPWSTLLPGSYGAGSAGKLMSDNLDAKVSTRFPTSSYVIPPTAASIAAATRDVNNLTPAANSLGAAVNSAASAGDPWSTAIPGSYADGTAGKILGTNVDAKISIMLPSATYVAPPTANQISEAVRDVDNTSPATNSLGAAVNAGSNDPLSNLVPGSYVSGTAGRILGDNLNATVSSRSTYAGTDTPGTTTLLTRVPSPITITGGKVDVNDKSGFSLTSAYDPAKTAAQAGSPMTLTPGERLTLATVIWETLTSAMIVVGSIGKWIVDRLDTTVSSRLATTSYVVPDNTGITAIKAKTDNLPSNPAAVSDIPTPPVIAAAVRDVNNATPPVGSLGAEVKAGSIAGDPWVANLPGSYAPGTAGNILGTRLDVLVSSRLAAAAITLSAGEVTVGTNHDKSGYSLTDASENEIADAILKRDWQALSGESAYSLLQGMRLIRNRWAVTPAGVLNVYREDGTTIAWSRNVGADPLAQPIVSVT